MRLNRRIKERFWRYFTYRNIQIHRRDTKLVGAYNNTVHSAIGMKPAHVDLYNAAQARANLQRQRTRQRPVKYPKYKVGDYVRISLSKGTFEKGFEKNYSEEIFKVCSVSQRQHIYLYEIQNLNGENIDSFFYTEELKDVGSRRLTAEQEFKVEHIIQSKGQGKKKLLLVKWVGHPEKFNSLIKVTDLNTV